ncbi:hypothetical protein BSKO_00085 [Bryopsis sp. KO-2023]|nr:hypothetical protein BSKO_00085 [Bryopsis sp. KO-2023]
MKNLGGVLLLFLALGEGHAKESFSEEVVVRPLPDGRVLAHFHFEQSAGGGKHHQSFPRAVDQLTNALDFVEIDVAFTRGRWRFERWGEPVIPPRPPGAELIARYPHYISPHQLLLEWGNLTHALSGLFCSSLNLLERSEMVLAPEILLSLNGEREKTSSRWLYGSLPQEPVCTENLTPWLKLLPCGDSQGVATLLSDRPTLYTTEYHSLQTAVYVSRSSPGVRISQRLVQTLTLVVRPQSQLTKPLLSPANWSFSSIFGHGVHGACVVADQSRIFLEIPWSLAIPQGNRKANSDAQSLAFSVLPKPDVTLSNPTDNRGMLVSYDVAGHSKVDLDFKWRSNSMAKEGGSGAQFSGFVAKSYLKDIRGDVGGLVIDVHSSTETTGEQRVCLLQAVPWFIRVWIHTLKISVDGQEVDPNSVVLSEKIHVAEDRQSPFGLEMCLKLKPGANSASVSFSFTKGFLSVTEHPPDAHRGFDIPSAMVVFLDTEVPSFAKNSVPASEEMTQSPLLSVLCTSRMQKAYTEGTLVHLATPDFSMPYNVCCLTSTVLAVYIGMVLKALTRRPKEELIKQGKKKEWKKRVLKIIVLMCFMGALVLYVDPDIRDSVFGFLADIGVISPVEQ